MSKQRIDEMKKFIQLSEELEETIHKGRKSGKQSIDLSGPDGNAFALIGYAASIGRQLGYTSEQVSAIQSEMKSGDYENLLTVFDREFGDYVDLYRGEDADEDLDESPDDGDWHHSYYNPRTWEDEPETDEDDEEHNFLFSGGHRFMKKSKIRALFRRFGAEIEDLGDEEIEVRLKLTGSDAEYLGDELEQLDLNGEFGGYIQLDDELEEGLGDKISGWFFKKGTEPLIAEIDKFGSMGPMIVASQVMQKPKQTQRAMIQGAKHYLENVKDHAGLRKFVDVMSTSEKDVYESSEEDAGEMFYVIVIDGSDRCVARLEKFGRSWHEECVFGDSPDGFGSKTYMGYLSPEDIISWLNRDYDTVAGPFENEYDAEIKMDRMAEEEGDADESWMYESVKLDNIVRSVLSEGAYEDYLRKTDPLGGFDDWDMDNPRGPRIEEPKTNLCPNCEGMGCDECEGEGEVFESGERDLTTTFEDALEIAYEMAEADPETESTQHLKKALVKAGGNGKDLKAFYEWLDEQGVYTHPSLLETDDDEDDRIIDVGDDEDFEDYSLPHNWNDDNSLEDEYKRGLRFD